MSAEALKRGTVGRLAKGQKGQQQHNDNNNNTKKDLSATYSISFGDDESPESSGLVKDVKTVLTLTLVRLCLTAARSGREARITTWGLGLKWSCHLHLSAAGGATAGGI